MKSSRRRWLVAGFLFLVVVGWAMGQIDYARVVDGKRPLFARFTLYLADGGSVQYLGLGYTVGDHHQYWDMEPPDVQTNTSWKPILTDMPTNSSWGPARLTRYRVGPTLDYWTPFMSRESLNVIVETN